MVEFRLHSSWLLFCLLPQCSLQFYISPTLKSLIIRQWHYNITKDSLKFSLIFDCDSICHSWHNSVNEVMRHRVGGQDSPTDKGKGHFMTCLCSHRGESRFTAPTHCSLCARWGGYSARHPRPLYPWERSSIHCRGDWWTLGPSLDGHKKPLPWLGFDSWSVQPVTTHCTNYNTPTALHFMM